MATFHPPAGYPRIQVVHDFAALLAAPLRPPVNAICWPRALPGDFDEVARLLAHAESAGAGDGAHADDPGIAAIDEARLLSLRVSAAGRRAIDALRTDQQRLRAAGHEPRLDCIRGYARDDDGPVPTDVHSFHVDSAPVPTETFLCTYRGPASLGLRNDEAVRCIDEPSLRTALRARFGDGDDTAFAAWLHEHCYDLHYRPTAGARPFDFGVGNLWRVAVQHPHSAVPACIHRAPDLPPALGPRLLLIS